MKLSVTTHFDAAHFLYNYNGACASLHGHRWLVKVTVGGQVNPVTDMLVDFKSLKALTNQILPDHKCLNEIVPFNPTAENLVVWLFKAIKLEINTVFPNITLREVELWETPECSVIYSNRGDVLGCL